MQSSYEVIKNAINFNYPDRLPVQFDVFGDCDTYHVGWNQIGAGDRSKKETIDEWGCKWSRTSVNNMGQVTGHPLYDWSNIYKFKWPDPDSKQFYVGMESKFIGIKDKYITTEIFMLLFERMHSLRGFENALTDLYLEREQIEVLADRIVEFNIRIVENIAAKFPGMIHGLTFTDDWGTEISTLISKDLWDEFFKPRYKKIFDVCKKAGWDIWMHSCGKINDIIPSLIDIGLNVINMQQPNVNGIKEIGQVFAGKICFQTTCDIQHTLPFKSAEEIEREAIDLMRYWGTEKGGFILSDYGDDEAIGVSNSKKRIMYEAFKKYDRYAFPEQIRLSR